MSTKAIEKLEVDSIEVVADKEYFDIDDLQKCQQNNIVPYVSKPVYSNSIGGSRYFSDKFRYNSKDNTYICPEGEILVCVTKKMMLIKD
ncbi:hypothetical protein FDF31_06980 [Clostridium sporogenes]|uniref:hypothetical protein n=1 Tax=Clostridium sp. LCP25S3_F8 TaxID=3438751 RepID=UPI0013D87045|nr:hypothetical protein [Clostridium sporogenes]NFS25388.1 hypothetical protein [Clostridium sporogenes]